MPTSEELKAGQRADWDAVAGAWEKWDAFQEAHSRAINEWLCHAAVLGPGQRPFDACQGIAIAAAVFPGAEFGRFKEAFGVQTFQCFA